MLGAVDAGAEVDQPAALVELAAGRVEQRGAERGRHGTGQQHERAGRTRRRPRRRPGRSSRPVRSTTDAGARRSGRFVSASIADDDVYGGEAAETTAHARQPVGLDDDVAELAGVARAARGPAGRC